MKNGAFKRINEYERVCKCNQARIFRKRVGIMYVGMSDYYQSYNECADEKFKRGDKVRMKSNLPYEEYVISEEGDSYLFRKELLEYRDRILTISECRNDVNDYFGSSNLYIMDGCPRFYLWDERLLEKVEKDKEKMPSDSMTGREIIGYIINNKLEDKEFDLSVDGTNL
ncbi:MAG: hypothetical protein ACRDD7_13745 [Peptostreptococcaceae bacterium]